jgi:two-component system, NarL family, sensor kinase
VGPEATDDGEGRREILRRLANISAQNERLFQRLTEGEQRFRGLAKAVWKVQEEERRRLARELHDGIGQTITALINQLRRFEQPGTAEAVRIAELALADVRELSRLLRPPVLDDLGLRAGLTWLARTVREHTGVETEIVWQADLDERFDPELETLVFRVVQEALNNIVKHSGEQHAHLAVSRGVDGLAVEIVDEGRGFEAAQGMSADGSSPGLGLRGIRDRIELFGGRFTLDSSPGRGCRLRIVVPVGEARQ